MLKNMKYQKNSRHYKFIIIYLLRLFVPDEFMEKARIEYKIGKRHLANMMGENPDNFSEDDVKVSLHTNMIVRADRPSFVPFFNFANFELNIIFDGHEFRKKNPGKAGIRSYGPIDPRP